MKQDYFVYNNRVYYTGTIVIMNYFDGVMGSSQPKEMTFCFYLPEKNLYYCKINNMFLNYRSNDFFNKLISVTNKIDLEYRNEYLKRKALKNKPMTFADELNIDGMLNAWIWYILIMAVSTIFNDRLIAWVCVSFIFFCYRTKKIKGGTK